MTIISSISKSQAALRAKKAKATNGGFSPSSTAETNAPSSAAKTSSTASLSALLALQSADYDAAKSNRKTIVAAQQILDELDQLQHAYLEGGNALNSFELLEKSATLRVPADAAPEVLALFDEIKLRARVELAKMGH